MNKNSQYNRRDFIKKTGIVTGSLAVAANVSYGSAKKKKAGNSIPKWKGFNLLDFFSPNPSSSRPQTQEEYFKWMADWGFDFVRIPMAYPSYLDIPRNRNITPEEVYKVDENALQKVDELVDKAHKYGLHVSLNLHRAPGFCVNAGFHEPYNLWEDEEAQEAFYWHWNMWAARYKNISRDKISFDLVNEPCTREDMNDQHSRRGPIPGGLYRTVAKNALDSIRKENPDHLVIADGNNVGRDAIIDLIDLDIAQSCRGYFPGIISHYKASWAFKDIENLPTPYWPGQVGDQYLSRGMLEVFYAQWVELVNQGVGVHCGECGCFNKTPHNVFIPWFADVLDILSDNGIGIALWEFRGSFGILDSGREDVDYEDWYGHKLDRRLLDLMLKA